MKIMTSVKLAQLSQAFGWLMISILSLGLLVAYVAPALMQMFQSAHPAGIVIHTPPPPLDTIPDANQYFPPLHGTD